MTYLLVIAITVGLVLVGTLFGVWQALKFKENYHHDTIWRGAICVSLFLVSFFFFGFGMGAVADNNYIERIETRYNIHVVENQDDADYAFVVFNEGKCVARKAPEDILIGVGCNPIPDELPRVN